MFAQDVSDIDKLAAELQRDGVVIESTMGGGEPTESHDRIAALVREVPFPVYVALVEEPAGLATNGGSQTNEALAALLHRRIGGEGMYVIGASALNLTVVEFGMGADPTTLSLVSSSNEKAVEAIAEGLTGQEYFTLQPVVAAELAVAEAEESLAKATDTSRDADWEATVSTDEASALADRAIALEASARWSPGRSSTPYVQVREASKGLAVGIGVVLGFAIALFLGQTLFGWPRRSAAEAARAAQKKRRTGPAGPTSSTPSPSGPTAPDPDEELDRARTALQSFVKRLARTAGRPVKEQAGMEQALLARDVAELVLADAEAARDPLAAIGAWAVVRTGDRDLSRGLDARTVRFTPCFFDPRHGHTGLTQGWEFGEGRVEVPCCRTCRADIDSGHEPASLHRPSRRGAPRPYWQDDDVWASTGFGALDEEFVATVASRRRGRA